MGKSTLTNALVGEKVAIVSNKPQTTRNRITAIINRGDTQLVLMDTPGFHRARTRLGEYMDKVVRESVADVDAVVLVVEPDTLARAAGDGAHTPDTRLPRPRDTRDKQDRHRGEVGAALRHLGLRPGV